MSGASSDQILSDAYDLIEAEKHDEAQAILEPILEHEPDNVDAWWLYAHAVTDPETGRMALNQVLRLDNSYQEAQELLAKLDESGEHVPGRLEAPPSLPEDSDMAGVEALEQDDVAGFSLDDTGPIFDDRSDETKVQKAGRAGLRMALGIVAILALLVIAAVLLLNPFASPLTQIAGQQTPLATSVAQQVVPTAENAPLTALPALEPVSSDIDGTIAEAMAGFDLVDGGVGTYETSLGKTLLASVCATGETLRDALIDSMNTIATTASAAVDNVQAVGIALIDCNADRMLRIIATSVEDAAAFSAGAIDARAFQARWIAAA